MFKALRTISARMLGVKVKRRLFGFDILLLFYTFSHSCCTRSRLIGPTKKNKKNKS